MDLLITIYWICFGFGLVYVLLSGALGAIAHGLAGAHADRQGELSSITVERFSREDGSPVIRYNPWSLLSLMGILSGFGAGGLAGASLKPGLSLSLACGALGALVAGALLWLLVGKLLRRLHVSSESHIADMVGLNAEVLTSIEPGVSGEIAYVLDGTRYTAPACLAHGGVAGKSEKVRILRVTDNLVYVERLSEMSA
jgi:hypothetical protein